MVTVDVRDFNDPPVFIDQRSDLAVTEVSRSRMYLNFKHTYICSGLEKGILKVYN